MTSTDLVKKLLAKAGVTYEGDAAEIPDDVATSLDNSLMTLDAAMNNHPKIKHKYFAEAYNGLDAEVETIMDENGLDETERGEVKAEKSSTKRAALLIRKIKEQESKKAGADVGKTNTLQGQIADLHSKLADEVKKQGDLKKTYEKQIKSIHIQAKLDSLLGGYKTVYDELPIDAKQAAVNSLLAKALQDSEAEFTFDEKGSLSVIKKDGTNLFGDNHTQLTPQSFIDKSLSKILKVSEPALNGNIQNTPVLTGQKTTNPNLSAALSESRKAYENSAKQTA